MKRFSTFSTSPRPRGVTLIMVAGMLSVLAALATGFYTLMLMQTKSASRYSDSVRADMMARAGMDYAIARIRDLAYSTTEDPNAPWYRVNYLDGARKRISFAANLANNGIDDDANGTVDDITEQAMPFSASLASSVNLNSDQFLLEVSDASSKININTGDNLAVTLDNLCRVVGAPLVAADMNMLQPACWVVHGANAALFGTNSKDKADARNLYFSIDTDGRPVRDAKGIAVYGDGYAIAGYRARNGRFKNVEDVKAALTYVERNMTTSVDDPMEMLEIEVKFAAIRDYITVDSWVDTNTVCVGKFEWVTDASGNAIAIDRDKSWVSSVDSKGTPIIDPENARGSLRGCYVSIMNGHGAGQFRRIKENGIDWLEIENGFSVPPGPISSYMIIAKPDAIPDPYDFNSPVAPDRLDFAPNGDLKDDPLINYATRPLCIHRAPVNINTASDKVLAALFLGINVQHGHPMAVGTDADLQDFLNGWYQADPKKQESELLTLSGLKRVPQNSGKLVFNVPMPAPPPNVNVDYLNNYKTLDPAGSDKINEANELAYRIIIARQRRLDASGKPTAAPDPDPLSKNPDDPGFPGYEKGPFKSWDDLYFRVIKPWDDKRCEDSKVGADYHKASVARMLMAHFNSNTDILKFNPNIEWIDRWGRNFTEMEPVMLYDGAGQPVFVPSNNDSAWPYHLVNHPVAALRSAKGAYVVRTLRYKSSELIDKTDLNRSTTEFSFDSAGIYEIQSVGQVMKRGEVLAEKKVAALVKVYSVWRESTQAQFVRGVIESPNGMGAPGSQNSGQVTRDAVNVDKRLPLTTLPEPLVPLNYTLAVNGAYKDVVDSNPYGTDAFGKPKSINGGRAIPDAVANRILPAQYDGQIALATNTSSYTAADSDTFLASFNGDLDTDTCEGNGREQAKTPKDRGIRNVDTIGLLGRLNDTEEDFDPTPIKDIYAIKADSAALLPLKNTNYSENVNCRMGDLRPDGVYLGNVGLSVKDASLKYNYHVSGTDYKNYDPRVGATISMWFKPNWHVQDGREHEFFNAGSLGDGYGARYNQLTKFGRYSGACTHNTWSGGTLFSENCLTMATEDTNDSDFKTYIHGGTWNPPSNPKYRESPSYRTQPFRWGFVGGTFRYKFSVPGHPGGQISRGYSEPRTNADGSTDPINVEVLKNDVRPFISTARNPEGPDWSARYMYSFSEDDLKDTTLGKNDDGTVVQPAANSWQQGANTTATFSINAINESKKRWAYRAMPIDGTMAVIDEFKLSKNMWNTTRIDKEQTTSRYFLPLNPGDSANCPTFTSQSLLQSLCGFDKTVSNELVTVARVSWNVFTPRFMHESKLNRADRTRNEVVRGQPKPINFRGPFDYIQYNLDILGSGGPAAPGVTVVDGEEALNPPKPFLGVDRPSPKDYLTTPQKQSHATRGVEVEIIVDGKYKASDKAWIIDDFGNAAQPANKMTFTDPNKINRLGNPNDSSDVLRVKTSDLKYRVRFRYPVDPLIEDRGLADDRGGKCVDPDKDYLLDTPVFDDISITYFSKPRVLAYKEISE
ncbi:MAG TPA: hypothetical protein VEK08_01165 [Planctomycetota bacterium]|nr:hypothetical protein [Planctomycetota bacterium]